MTEIRRLIELRNLGNFLEGTAGSPKARGFGDLALVHEAF